MYYPAATHLHYFEAQRILELHRMQCLMEKHHHAHTCDPYEPIRRLAMVENASRNPRKQLTSFRINDILEQKGQHVKDTNETCNAFVHGEQNNKGNDSHESLEDSDFSESSAECSTWHSHDSKNRNASVISSNKIIRPWSISPSSSESDNNISKTFGEKIHASGVKFVKRFEDAKRLRLESGVSSDDEEIDVEGCDDKNGDESKPASICERRLKITDLSPLGALVAMSNKTFHGLESFGKQSRASSSDGSYTSNSACKHVKKRSYERKG